jgi:hypothetical protein
MSKRKSAASPSEELTSSDVKKRKRNDVSYVVFACYTSLSRPQCPQAVSTPKHDPEVAVGDHRGALMDALRIASRNALRTQTVHPPAFAHLGG